MKKQFQHSLLSMVTCCAGFGAAMSVSEAQSTSNGSLFQVFAEQHLPRSANFVFSNETLIAKVDTLSDSPLTGELTKDSASMGDMVAELPGDMASDTGDLSQTSGMDGAQEASAVQSSGAADNFDTIDVAVGSGGPTAETLETGEQSQVDGVNVASQTATNAQELEAIAPDQAITPVDEVIVALESALVESPDTLGQNPNLESDLDPGLAPENNIVLALDVAPLDIVPSDASDTERLVSSPSIAEDFLIQGVRIPLPKSRGEPASQRPDLAPRRVISGPTTPAQNPNLSAAQYDRIVNSSRKVLVSVIDYVDY